MLRLFCLTAAVLFLTGADTPITKKNWLRHPRIEAVRAKVKAIQKAIDDKKYKTESNPACEAPNLDMERDAWRDEKGRIRLYVWGGGSDDSSFTMQTFYDEEGKTLFVFGQEGHVPSKKIEYRLYFENGKEVWRDVKESGEGPSPFRDFPDKLLVPVPEDALKAPKKCQ